jgi:hypothetical protein
MSETGTVRMVGSDADEIVRLEAEIASKRAHVARSLGELRQQLHGATSWRHWFGSRAVVWLGVGLCLGVLVGYGARRGRRLD